MNTLHLKYALEVERSGSISQAAQNLFMAQPNLSKAIRDLESDLGYQIFKRKSRAGKRKYQKEVSGQQASSC